MSQRRPAVRLFWFFFALYALTSSGNAFRVPDEFEVYFQVEHLLDAGDISVPQTLGIRQEGQSIFFGKFGLDGRPWAPYGPGVAVLLVPFHLTGRAVARLAGIQREALPAGIAWEFVVGGVTALGMAFAAALAVAAFYRGCVALGATPAHGTRLALLLGGATVLWPYGTTLYSEAWLAAAYAGAAALLLEARAGAPRSSARVAGAAVLVAVAGLVKPTALLLAPGFVIAALLDDRAGRNARVAAAVALSAGIAVAAGAQMAWNLARFGRALDFGYNFSVMIPQASAALFTIREVPRGLFVQLLTPGKSLFVWAPVTLLSIVALRPGWRVDRGLTAGVTAAAIAALAFYAAFLFPEGGYAHGPRHLVPLVPLLMLPLALPGVEAPRRALIGCAAAGFAMAALAVSVSFLEDQAPAGAGPRSIGPYYDRIENPAPGSPANRYRADYIPFKFALGSGRWLAPDRAAGNGPDFFALHLRQGRLSLPGGAAIPRWLPWAVSLPWVVVLAWAGRRLLCPPRERAA